MSASGSDPTKTMTSAGLLAQGGGARIQRLVVVHGPSQGAVQVLAGGPFTIARGDAGPLELLDSEVSKQHARVEQDEGAATWSLTDLGSRNGTFVQGRRCQRIALTDGTVIRVGASVLLFEDLTLTKGPALDLETDTLPGPSLAMQQIRAEIRVAAPQPMPVLILGESGVGKELVAREVHRQSGRGGAFIPVNCSAIPEHLAESELFGHVAGAFTGAQRKSEGLFMAANQGTLFLDEVGEMPLEIQPKLLRAIALGEVKQVGSTETAHADVRLIAATHRDLSKAVEENRFRGDLLARLSAWKVAIPPLRLRRQDVLALARLFLSRLHRSSEMTSDAAEALVLHDWPYNVRELEQVLAAAAARSNGAPIALDHLPADLSARLQGRKIASGSPKAELPLEVLVSRDRAPSKEDLCVVLERLEGNMAEVAEFFGKDRRQIYRWAEKLGVNADAFRKP